MEVHSFSTIQGWISESADLIYKYCGKGGHLALSGGSTPRSIYKAVAGGRFDYGKLHLYQVDERYVPADDEKSNRRLIEESFERAMGDLAGVYCFDTSVSIEESLTAYEQELPEQFDLCVLGIGPDGHTASLFPGVDALKEEERFVAHTETGEFAVRDRLTITFPMILKSKAVLVLLKGKKKGKILHQLFAGEKSEDEMPALRLLDHDNLYVYYCEEG